LLTPLLLTGRKNLAILALVGVSCTSWKNTIGVVAMELSKVASQSNPDSVAGAIAGALEQDAAVEMHAIGACPVNQ